MGGYYSIRRNAIQINTIIKMSNTQPFVSVFTPVYNRAYILPQLYLSLCQQTNKNFEWVVIDDGSTDSSRSLIRKFKDEGKIDIRFSEQPNGGKHRAINQGVRMARGRLFFIVDSDDRISTDAIDWIIKTATPILDNNDYAGISGIRITPEGNKIGGGCDFGTIDANALDIRFKHKISGDLAEVYKTEVLHRFPFPSIDGEKFCPEAIVWNRIAKHYKLRYCHKGIYICKYLPDGLTAKITRLRRESPITSMTYYSELYHSDIPFIQKLKAAINFWRFALSDYKANFRMHNPLSLAAYIPGRLFRILDSKNK